MVQLAHEGPLGFEKTLGLLRESNWFPGIFIVVRTYVETCVGCQVADPSTSQEPLKTTLLSKRP